MSDEQFVQLNRIIQSGFPLVEKPYRRLAGTVGISPKDIQKHIMRLAGNGVIREVSGIFDAQKLGYDQTLVAAKLPPSGMDRATKIIHAHPGISHCYLRSDEFNLWCTLAISRSAPVTLAQTTQGLAHQLGADGWLFLPTVTKFKLNVMFDLASGEGKLISPADEPTARTNGFELTEAHRKVVRILQKPAPLQNDNPFELLASQNGFEQIELLKLGNQMLAAGVLRRYCAVVNHRLVGAGCNVMAAWNVAKDRIISAGQAASLLAQVSHCYHRQPADGWNYNLYTMIHARDMRQAEGVIDGISQLITCRDFKLLWTLREIKKQRLRFFE